MTKTSMTKTVTVYELYKPTNLQRRTEEKKRRERRGKKEKIYVSIWHI